MINAMKHYKAMSRQKQRQYDIMQTEKLMKAKCNNAKLYWKMLTGKNNKQNTCPITCKEFYNHFLKLSDPEDNFFQADREISGELREVIENDIEEMYAELNVPMNESELRKAVIELKCGKSGGENLIINELLMNGFSVLCPYMLQLFNFIFEAGIFPEMWGNGLLVPLHKKGSMSVTDNYRGITLLSALGKLFTRVLNNRLDGWAEAYGIYLEAQNGFRKGRGTTDSLFIIQNVINEFIENGKKLYVFFVDYSKAFDFVVHDNLWYKLLQYGIRGKIFNIIHSMYQYVKTKVFSNGITSDPFYCKLGVRQGECLSPFLFAMYVNDLENSLNFQGAGITISHVKMLLLLYADDVVIFAETAEYLQMEIDKLHTYCNKWRLKVNASKSQVLVFKKGRVNSNESWYYGETQLTVATKISYLGLVFTTNGQNYQTQLALSEQANKAVFQLHKNISSFSSMPVSNILDLFDKLIVPILNYGSEVWGFHQARDIERVHLSFCKRVLGVKKSTQNDFIYGLLGRMPMYLSRQLRIVKYWLKIVSGQKSMYVNVVYNSCLERIDKNSTSNWAYNVKQLLFRYGFGNVWVSQGVDDPDVFYNEFRTRLMDIFAQEWKSRLADSTRAVFYRNVVSDCKFSALLDVVNIKSHRIALTRLVASSHRLRVETGRWVRPPIPRDERLCPICNKQKDEYHIIFECRRFSDLRKKLIPAYYLRNISMFKCVQIFSDDHKKTVRNLAKFIHLAFKEIV